LEFDSQTALDLIADTTKNDFHPHATLLSLIRNSLLFIGWFSLLIPYEKAMNVSIGWPSLVLPTPTP